MLRNYPSHTHLRNRFSQICSQHVGILESQIIAAANSVNYPNIELLINSMPNYHKLIIGEHANVTYHLSGYGIYKEESLIRLLGEGIERYALVIAQTMYRKNFEFMTYREAEKKGDVIPFEYMKLFTDADFAKWQTVSRFKDVTKDHVISWLKCPSLFDEGREIYVPAQFLFVGYVGNKTYNDHHFTVGFSKGTSTHTNLKKALKSAILEAVEADSLMNKWYSKLKSKRVIIDDPTLANIIAEKLGGFPYEMIPILMNMPDTPGYTFGVALVHKKYGRPYLVMGCQSGLDPVQTLYRAFMEALGIFYFGTYGPLISPENFLETDSEEKFDNLDSNVSFYGDPEDGDSKRQLITDMCEGEVALSGLKNLSSGNDDDDILYLLRDLRDISEYGVYLDLTPPEAADKGWKVIRTFFPELVQLALPNFPYSNHPRTKQYGGVLNDHPHPLP